MRCCAKMMAEKGKVSRPISEQTEICLHAETGQRYGQLVLTGQERSSGVMWHDVG
jgi:hypothetical protein